ncbi:MAG: ABC transporter substrate-binding protein [Pseudomonadota bacterium]
MRRLHASLLALLLFLGAAELYAADSRDSELPTLRVAVLKYGTANWELELISQLGLDRANGFRLELLQRVSPNASLVALQGGAADFTVADWLWVAEQQAAQREYHFYPYSSAVGELLVPPDSPATQLADLEAAELGVAGGAEDKSWLLFQAYAKQQGMDLREMTKPRYAAPPLLNGLASTGQLDAVLTYWHYAARLKAAGFRPILSLEEVLARLGVESELPMLGWVFSAELGRNNPDLVDGFLAASYAAKSRLLTDDTAWERIEPLMRADSADVFRELRDGYRAGVPGDFAVAEMRAIKEVAAIVAAARAGPALPTGERGLPDSVFWTRGDARAP